MLRRINGGSYWALLLRFLIEFKIIGVLLVGLLEVVVFCLPSKNASANNDWGLGSEDDADDESAVVADDNNIDDKEQQQCLDLHKIEMGESLPTIFVLGLEGTLKN